MKSTVVVSRESGTRSVSGVALMDKSPPFRCDDRTMFLSFIGVMLVTVVVFAVVYLIARETLGE